MDRPFADCTIAFDRNGGWYCGEHFSGGHANTGNVTLLYSQDHHCCLGSPDIWPVDVKATGQLLFLRYFQYPWLFLMASVSFFNWACGVMLIAVRLATLFVATPVFGSVPVPARAKIVLIIALAVGLAGAVQLPSMQQSLSWLVSAMISELIIGAAMASALFAGFGAFHFGGRLLDFQSGYGIAGLVDIATHNNAPLLGTLFSMLAVLIFFTVDGHLAMLKVLQLSFLRLPIGAGISNLDIGALIAYFGTCFVFGFAIVAPVVLCLFLVDIGMAFMSRTMPQMNVFVMSLGLKVLVGWLVLAWVVPFSGGLIRSVYESIFNVWDRALA